MFDTPFSRRSFLQGFGLAVASSAIGWPALALSAGEPAALRDSPGTWELAFGDDFADAGRFERHWRRVTSYGDFTETLRLPENVVVDGDGLDLMLGANPRREPKFPFSGGYVETRSFRQCYGYFECEMRIANEEGVNNAFWMVSQDATDDGVPFELNIVEAKFPNHVQVAARRWTKEREVVADRFEVRTNLAESFHRYGMLWSPAEFRFYYDDDEVFAAPNAFAHTPAILRFSNAVADFAGEDDGNVTGAATTIRSVRAFRNLDWDTAAALEREAA
jgi:beta-glucanase (GH16 family)